MKEKINKFVNSGWFVVLIGLIAILSYSLEIYSYIRILMFLALGILFIVLGNVNAVIPMLFVYKLAVHPNIASSTLLFWLLQTAKLIALLGVVVLIVKAIKNKKRLKTGKLFFGIVAAALVILISGLSNSEYVNEFFASNINNLLIGLVEIFVLYFAFVNFSAEENMYPENMFSFDFLKNKNKESDMKNLKKTNKFGEYVLFSLIMAGLVVLVQLIIQYAKFENILYAMQHKLIRVAGNRINGPALYVGMATFACLFFATVKKQKAIWLTLMVILYAGLLTTFSRGVVLFTTCLLIPGIVYSIYRTENKKNYLISIGAIFAVLLISFTIFHKQIFEIFSYFGKMGLNDNGRKEWWDLAIEKFKDNPVFGIGLYGDDAGAFPGDIWYFHNTVLQILACTGIVGIIGFALFYFQRYKLLLSNWSVMQTFILLAILLFEMYGMIDINSFRAESVAMVILLCAVVELESKENKLPFCIDRKGLLGYNKTISKSKKVEETKKKQK